MTVAIDTSLGSSHSAEDLLSLYQITPEDLARVAAAGQPIIQNLQEHIDAFYVWLEKQPFFSLFFQDENALARVKDLQNTYWRAFFRGNVDEDYAQQRRIIGETHARIGLPPQAYLPAMNTMQNIFTSALEKSGLGHEELASSISSMTKLMHLDAAIVMDEFMKITSDIISQQSKALMEMSTPVTAIWQGILMLPIVGIIDSKRSMDIMNAMLAKISETRSKVIILDISGVGVVDTAVANHLIKITRATKLMGCDCTISGVSPAIAQTIVELGIDVGDISTTATLRDALESAFRATGVDLKRGG
jgi:rsbT co-antagonist protein RsbR